MSCNHLARVHLGEDIADFYQGVSRVAFECPRCPKRVEPGEPSIKRVRLYYRRNFIGRNWFGCKCCEGELMHAQKTGWDL